MEKAEAYVMKRMEAGEVAVYEKHLAHCPPCTRAVAMTRAFVQGMRDALRQLVEDDEKPN